jgi:chromosome segregation ATPase
MTLGPDRRRPHRRSLAALALGGLVFLAPLGCDKMESAENQGDREMKKAADEGWAKRRLPTTQSLKAALTDFNTANGVTSASLTTKIRARTLQAQTEFDLGTRDAADLRKLYPQIGRLIWEIGQDGIRITEINEAAAAITKTEPTLATKAVADKRAEMVMAGEAAGQAAAALQGKIDAINKQVADWQQQKDALIKSADDDANASKTKTGKEASDLLDKAAESRRKGSNLGHDIDKLSSGLFALQRDLDVEQLKKKTADDAVAALDARKKGIDDAWAASQAEVKKLQDEAKAVGQELADKAKALDDLNKRADALRKSALARFDDAAKHYKAATDDATKLVTTIGSWERQEKMQQSTERPAWKRTRELYTPNNLNRLQAEALHAQGALLSEQAAIAREEEHVAADLAAPLGAAQVTVPATLTDAAGLKAAADADKMFNAAAQKYADAYGGGFLAAAPTVAARIGHMYALFGEYVNSARVPDKLDATKLAEPKKEYDEIQKLDPNDPALKLAPEPLVKGG